VTRSEKRLSNRTALALTKPGRHADGGARDGFGRSWVYLYRWQGRTREMGLGKCFAVTLADAREARDRWRKVLQSGQDPLAVRHVAPRSIPTFGECADQVLKTMLAKSHNARHQDQWRESLQEIAAPLRRLPVDTVDTKAIVAALKPIWGTPGDSQPRARRDRGGTELRLSPRVPNWR
jgi:Arm DNA-binding domain